MLLYLSKNFQLGSEMPLHTRLLLILLKISLKDYLSSEFDHR